MPNQMSLLEAAHDYARRGFRVIPLHRVGPDGRTCSCNKGANCTSAGKHPKDLRWQEAPRLSGPDIEDTWGVEKAPNLGLATGRDSGFWVLDIDPKGGGMETMAALVAEHGELPATLTTETGSGGYHYFFSLGDEPLRNTQNRVGLGVDTRAEGGQVVAAPSRTSKGDYRIIRDAPIVAAPDWLLKMVRRDHVDVKRVTSGDLPRPEEIDAAQWQRLNNYAKSAVNGNLERLDRLSSAATQDGVGYRGEAWNHTTFEVACALIEVANSPWNAYSTERAYQDLFSRSPRDAGFDDWTVNKTWQSAMDKVQDKARPMPEDRKREPDPLFEGVRSKSDPTEGGEGEQPRLVAGEHGDPEAFFDRANLLVADFAEAVRAEGPIAWGADERWWAYADGVWRPDARVVNRRGVRLLGNKFRTGHADQTSAYLRDHDETMHVSGDPHPRYMNFRNGMLDWQTGEIVPHAPEFFSTVQFPLDYKENAECPTFDGFLDNVMHEDYVALAWEMIGYLMYSGNPQQVAFLLYGTGGNGKGTLVRVIQNILGMENIANEPLDRLNGDRFSTVNLFAKIANIAGDIDATYQESTANFKRLTGEDVLAAERKYGDRFNFENWAVPLFSANKIPGSSDVTEGYLRRWVVLHFHKRIIDPKQGLSHLLSLEIEGVAAKAVLALREQQKRGKFEPKGEAIHAKEEFARSIDQVRQWIRSDKCVDAPGVYAPCQAIYEDYTEWSQSTGRGRLTETEFRHRMNAAGIPVERAPAHGDCYVGIRTDRMRSVEGFAVRGADLTKPPPPSGF